MNDSDFVKRLQARAVILGLRIEGAHARELELFYALLAKWNKRINLTALNLAPTPETETIDRLFIEPLIACEMIPASTSLSVLDLGSGAGSPAIPMKVLRPSIDLTMVETRGRKAAFLREAIRTLHLQDVDVEQSRFQELSPELRETFDIVAVRALRVDDELLTAVNVLLDLDGRLMLFGVQEAPEGFVIADQRTLPDGSLVATCERLP